MKTIFLWLITITAVALLISNRPSNTYSSVSDTAESQEMMAAIQRAKDAIAVAQSTGDVSKLEEGLIDHPDFLSELGQEQQEELRQFVGRVSGPRAAQTFGYLTAMKNKITYRLQGEEFVRKTMEKAKAENHEFTSADLQSLASQNPDKYIAFPQPSTVITKSTLVENSTPVQRQYKSIKIEGDKARVTYD